MGKKSDGMPIVDFSVLQPQSQARDFSAWQVKGQGPAPPAKVAEADSYYDVPVITAPRGERWRSAVPTDPPPGRTNGTP